MKTNNLFAYVMAICKAVIYGTTAIFTNRLLETVDILDILSLRFLISAFIFQGLRCTGIIKVKLRKKRFFALFATVCFEPVLYFVFETIAIANCSTMVIGSLAALAPLFAMLTERIFLREKSTFMQKIFMMIRILGVLLIVVYSRSGGSNSIIGIIFMILALISGSAYFICVKIASRDYKTEEITYFYNVFAAVVFNAVNIIRHIYMGNIENYFIPMANADVFVGIVYLAVVSSSIAAWCQNYSASKLLPSISSALGGITTITTIFTGVVFNNESFTWYHLMGAVMIITGILGMSCISENCYKGINHHSFDINPDSNAEGKR